MPDNASIISAKRPLVTRKRVARLEQKPAKTMGRLQQI